MSRFGSKTHYLSGGAAVPIGELESVGKVSSSTGSCTGTLITDNLVLTAAHCVCSEQTSREGCVSRASFTFRNVILVSDSSSRQDITVEGDVLVFPDYAKDGHWLSNDFALIRLDMTASSLIKSIEPIPVERPDKIPKVGDNLTLVGFGRTGTGCAGSSIGKQKATLPVSKISDVPNITIRLNDPDMYSCPGDSGGPALNSNGNVIGVASSANFNGNSNYDPTYLVYDWIFGVGRLLRVVGRVTFLRVHDVGTGFGSPTDPVEGEVIVRLDTSERAFGLTLRDNFDAHDHLAMLKTLQSVYVNEQTIALEYIVTGPSSGKIFRLINAI